MNPDICDNEILPDNNLYKIYRNDRIDRRGGGVLVAIKKTLQSYCIDNTSSLEIVWAAFPMSSGTILIGACYRAPASDNSFLNSLRDSVSEALHLCPANHVYLFGDFNFMLIDWEHMSSSCHASLELINLTLDFNLFQIIKEPTRALNILDLVFTNVPDTVVSLSNVDGFSDHNLIQLTLNIPKPVPGTTKKQIRDYNRANYDEINSELEHFFHEVLLPSFNFRSVNDNWVLYRDKLSKLVDRYVPVVSISNDNSSPWFTQSLRKLRNKKKRSYKRAKHVRTSEAWQAYKDCLKSYCSAISLAKQKYYSQDLPSLLNSNPKKFWRTISPAREANTITLHGTDNIPIPSADCPTVFNTFFSSVFTQEDYSNVPTFSDLDAAYMEPITITVEGIVSLISNLKISTSAGIDNINSKILKNTLAISSQILCHIFQQSLTSGELPADWLVGKIIPIHKTGDIHSPDNPYL